MFVAIKLGSFALLLPIYFTVCHRMIPYLREHRVAGIPAFAFVLLQVVALTHVVAELMPDSLAVQAIAAVGWLIAFAPWVLRSTWIYLTPRADGASG